MALALLLAALIAFGSMRASWLRRRGLRAAWSRLPGRNARGGKLRRKQPARW